MGWTERVKEPQGRYKVGRLIAGNEPEKSITKEEEEKKKRKRGKNISNVEKIEEKKKNEEKRREN